MKTGTDVLLAVLGVLGVTFFLAGLYEYFGGWLDVRQNPSRWVSVQPFRMKYGRVIMFFSAIAIVLVYFINKFWLSVQGT